MQSMTNQDSCSDWYWDMGFDFENRPGYHIHWQKIELQLFRAFQITAASQSVGLLGPREQVLLVVNGGSITTMRCLALRGRKLNLKEDFLKLKYCENVSFEVGNHTLDSFLYYSF